MSRIQITCDTPGAEIYYSINNDNLDQLYTTPFEVNEEGEIYAIGRKEGMKNSDVGSKEVIKLPTPNLGSNVTTEAGNITIYNIDEYAPLGLNQMAVVFSYDSDISTTYKEVIFNSFIAGEGITNIVIQNTLEYNQSIYAKAIADGFLDSDIDSFTRKSTIG